MSTTENQATEGQIMHQPQIKTPCIGVCSTGLGDRVCRGCNRFTHEVIDWNKYTLNQKAMIQARLQGLCRQACRYWLKILSLQVLQEAAINNSLAIEQHYTGYDIAYELLRKSGDSFTHLKELGLAARDSTLDGKPTAVLVKIEEHLYSLSLSHYQRYFAPLVLANGADGG